MEEQRAGRRDPRRARLRLLPAQQAGRSGRSTAPRSRRSSCDRYLPRPVSTRSRAASGRSAGPATSARGRPAPRRAAGPARLRRRRPRRPAARRPGAGRAGRPARRPARRRRRRRPERGRRPRPGAAAAWSGSMESLRRLRRRRAAQRAWLLAALRRPRRPGQDRLLAVLGSSVALGDHLVPPPRALVVAAPPRSGAPPTSSAAPSWSPPSARPTRSGGRADRRTTPCASPTAASCWAIAALRPHARPRAVAELPEAAAALADLAERRARGGARDRARASSAEAAARCRLAVIGMGKCGGRELNYVSDVDVIFVAEPADGGRARTRGARGRPRRLATGLMRACCHVDRRGHALAGRRGAAARGQERPAGPDAREPPRRTTSAGPRRGSSRRCSRPGRSPATSRSGRPTSTRSRRWSGRRPSASNFVEDVQAMRRRVEEHVPAGEADRQLKLGPGGLRDVEFSVQLLQLVHGRTDETLRSRHDARRRSRRWHAAATSAATTPRARRGLPAAAHAGAPDPAAPAAPHPPHARPTRPTCAGSGARSGTGADAARRGAWPSGRRQAREVRRLHEKLFYRPLLTAVARLSTDEARLTPEAARERLAALGFRDPAGALRHIEALTDRGQPRRARSSARCCR